MTFNRMLNIRMAVWIACATVSTLLLPRGWHDFCSCFLIMFAWIDRSLCRIAHAMEAKSEKPEAQPDARPDWVQKADALAHAERRRTMAKRPGGVEV
jgi:hypothetical protein